MKRFYSKAAALLAAVMAAFSLAPMASVTAAAEEPVRGDIDGDGYSTSADSLMILRASVELIVLTPEQLKLADLNGDGYITSADALDSLVSSLGGSGEVVENDPEREYKEILRLCNIERKNAGLPELKYDTAIEPAAQTRAKEIVSTFDHVRPDGRPWETVLNENNYNTLANAENIAGGQKSAYDVVKAWLKSPGHRKNIMNPEYTHMGAALYNAEGSEYGRYWVQIFSKRASDFQDEKTAENNVLDQINSRRENSGLYSLRMNETLRTIAETRADELLVLNETTRPDGSKFTSLLDAYGVDYSTTTQIVCSGQQTSAEVIDYLANNSPKLFDPSKGYTSIGIGHAFKDNDTQGHYWVIIVVG